MKIQSIREFVIKSLPVDEEKKRVLNRRLNKLSRDPKGFFESSYKKRSAKVISKIPIKYKSDNSFTVVSAVYNVEKYLDDYFKSLVNQTISFNRYIQLVLVDDGSTDSSAKIIKKWQKKYPKNITYLYKENGGQSSARNLGLEHVTKEWVAFIDPDDFIDLNYFKNLDREISSDNNIKILASNIIFYIENENVIKDNHPLRYRFSQERSVYPVLDLGNTINLSAAASLFKSSIIKNSNLSFDEKVKPNFEDGKFIADYLLYVSSGSISYSESAIYYYRKREALNSTIDSSWKKKEKFNDVLEHGFVAMLEGYKASLGYVPMHIQKTALYDVAWYVKYLVNESGKTSFLNTKDLSVFLELIKKIIQFVDKDTILNFNLTGIWFLQKVGILGAFKDEKPYKQIAYIENIDKEKKQILISYFTYFDVSCSFRLNNIDIVPKYKKIVKHTFANQLFVHEKRYWIPYDNEDALLTIDLDMMPVRITLQKKQHHHGIRISDILKAYQPSPKYHTDCSWLLMDRDTQADDNAEHMYRYLMHNHPEQNIYFALRKTSHDWRRLQLEGFNLVDFGSEDFEYHLRKASKIISSHLDRYINNYFGDEYEYSKRFVFLQHGVTMNNMSSWFNAKKNLQCVITATKPECQSLVENDGLYKLTKKEVALTGFPRHDNLMRYNQQDSKIILIMPTWRQNIMGKVAGTGNTREINDGFMETSYAQHWYNVLHSKDLEKLAQQYSYKIIFAPHANIEPYMTMFNVPSHIDIWQASTATNSMQQLFQQAKLMITDYSSVAFEMGLLEKTVLYYQFDKDEVFSGGHIIQRGYFSYENDGFGPVVTHEAELLLELERILANNGEPLEPYATRIKDTFAYRDTNNCQRVYEAIIDLDRPDTSEVSVDTIMEYAQQAITHEAWDLALERIDNALQHSDITQVQLEVINRIKEQVIQTGYQDEPVKLANILWKESRIEEALNALKQVNSAEVTDELLRLRVKLAILNNDFKLARDSQRLLLENHNESSTIEDWQFYTHLVSTDFHSKN